MKSLTLIDIAFLLKKTTLFSSLDLDLLLTLADKMELEEYKKGTKIFERGQEGNRLYIIVQGTILIQNPLPLAELSTYELFGDEALLSEKPRAYDAIALSDTQLLTFSQSHLLALLAELPTVSASLLEAFAAVTPFRPRSKQLPFQNPLLPL